MMAYTSHIKRIAKMASIKTLTIRLPKELWVCLKGIAVQKEKSVNQLLVDLLQKEIKKSEKKS